MMQPYGYDYAGRPVYNMQQQQLQQAYTQQMPQMQAQQPMQQIRNGGIVSVPNEDFARSYPVAPGVTVTMRDESGPYLYEKTMGFSQLDQPVFRKARIVFEDAQESHTEAQQPATVYAEIEQLESLRDAVIADIKDLHSQLDKETAEIRSLVAAMIKPDEPKRTAKKKEAEEE